MPDVIPYASLPHDVRAAIHSGASRILCPKCKGGSSHELSLAVYASALGMMKLSCWRSTCGWWAQVVTDPSVRVHASKLRVGTAYEDAILPLSQSMGDALVSDYGICRKTATTHGWGQTPDCRLIMPVRDRYGRELGHVTRTFTSPKRVMTYKATDRPWLDYWLGSMDRLVVVEDQISACRLASVGLSAVALMGTNMSTDQARDMAAARFGRVYLALDRDAFIKSLKLVSRHAHIVPLLPVCLEEDVKNMQLDRQIEALFA